MQRLSVRKQKGVKKLFCKHDLIRAMEYRAYIDSMRSAFRKAPEYYICLKCGCKRQAKGTMNDRNTSVFVEGEKFITFIR